MFRKSVIGVICFLLVQMFVSGLDTPEKFFGFKPGADYELAHHNKIKDYFVKVGKESPRVVTQLIGKTTLNNDMVLSVISSEENIKNLDTYKDIVRKLSLAEVGDDEAKKLAAKGKAVVFVTCNLHSNEIGSNQMASQLLYDMATSDSPEMKKILDNVIFVFMPSVNPDGQIMVVEWYYKNKGTKYEGSFLPVLYHWYAGHDNNRDWFKFNLKESWLANREFYFHWFPQVLVDEHQMGSSGDRFFIPPYADPPTPGVHPLVWRTINIFGSNIAFDMEKRGMAGVASRGYFQGWWIGALDDCAWFHNIPGVLFEAASTKSGSPIYVEPEEVRSGVSRTNEERMFSPNPWKGGWWRLGDIVEYDYHATVSVLNTAARHREELLWNSYKMAKDNIEQGKKESPFAYVVPAKQWDPMTAEKYVKTLLKSNIKIYRLTEPLQTGNHYFAKGSFVVPLAQPYRSFVKNIMERQHYPDIRRSPADKKINPYDGAGWTLHLGMGVNAIEIKKPFKAKMTLIGMDDVFKRPVPDNLEEYIVLEARHNNSFLAASALLKKGVAVWRNYKSDAVGKGAFVTKKSAAMPVLKEINKTMPLVFESRKADQLPLDKLKKLKPFKIALYQNYGHNMEEGWTRFVFDEFKIPYDTVRFKDFKKKNWKKIMDKYDILFFVGASKSEIDNGKPPKKWEKYFSPLPPEYMGGLGKEGKKQLEAFLKKGKTIIFMTESVEYGMEKIKLPATDVIKEGLKSKVTCPGSYLEVLIKESELTFGMPPKGAVYYRVDPTFSTFLPRDYSQKRRTPVVFGLRDLLLSGSLGGEQYIARKALAVDVKTGGGRVILFGPNFMYRGQTEGMYKIVFNALFTAAK